MKDTLEGLLGKFNSYEIFGNFIPGAAFCIIYQIFYDDVDWSEIELFERILIYYLIGIIIGRLGEGIVKHKFCKYMCDCLRKIIGCFKTAKLSTESDSDNKDEKKEDDKYLNYVKASENKPFIRILHETSICYRALVGVFVCHLFICVLSVFGINLEFIAECIILRGIVFLAGIFLFWCSYVAQEKVVGKRVDSYEKQYKN